MCRQVVSFAVLALLCSFGTSRLLAQGSAPAAVNESAARATLLSGAIRLELPFTAPVTTEARVVARILAPDNAASGQTEVAVPPGSRSARLTLSWPRDAKGEPVEDIGWFRIGYELQAMNAPAARGILSIGAITPNLLALRLVRPQAVSGAPIRLRVFAGNPVTGKPFRGVRLKATLAIDDDSGKKSSAGQPVVRSAVTGADGEAILVFPGLPKPGDTGSLTLEGTLAGVADSAFAHATLTADLETRDQTIFQTNTDKPLHKPGEIVHLRTLVLNDAGRAAANVPLTLTIKDPQDKTVIETPLTTNHFGIAAYDWKTTPQTATGNYTATFDQEDTVSGGNNFSIPIQRYDLPEFNVTAEMDRSFYLAGQTPQVKLHAGYLFGKPVSAGSVKVVRSDMGARFSRGRKPHEAEETVASGPLDANGDVSFPLDVKNEFSDLAGEDYERYRDLQFRAIVTDASTGRSEPRNFTVRLTRYPVHIYLGEPEGGDRDGDVLVSTSYADGTPTACNLQLDWMDENSRPTRAATAVTSRYGLARVHLRYPFSTSSDDSPELRLRVTARDPEGRISLFDDTLRPISAKIWISTARSLLRPNEPIQAWVHADPGSLVDIDVLSETEILDHLQIRMRRAEEPFTVPSDSRFHGLIALRAYRFTQDQQGYDSWRGKSVLYPENRELLLKSSGIKPSYLPGAPVDAALRLSSAANASLLGAIGVTVFDSAVAQRAETEEDANNPWFFPAWWNEGPTAGGLTLADLNKVDTSRPIPDDLELAAEAVLADASENEISIEGSSDLTIRNQYSQLMEDSLKALGKAIEGVPTPRLPRTFADVQQVARDARLDSGLLDPWNTPYRIDASYTTWNESVSFVSAGPDKKFGTDDDLTIPVADRNIFAVPGAKLNSTLTAAAASGRPLPATVDQLKVLASAGGLDLDSAAAGTRAPNGHLFRYVIVVARNFYRIDVDNEDNFSVWATPSIDYFSSTEARIDAALRAWTDSGKSFPETEAEARQVLASAGIDFDSLRDPLGQPFQLRVTDTFAYTMQQHMKANDKLNVTNKPVTKKMRAIQILRTPSAPSSKPASAEEIVAQFLHPLTEQSGGDLAPQPSAQGTFKGNSGAIAGTVTDVTGAVVQGAIVTIRSADGKQSSAQTDQDGTYLVRDLAPGLYRLTASAKGFESFEVYEVRVSAAALTTVDIELTVGTEAQTVTVEADALNVATDSNVISRSFGVMGQGVVGPDRKTIVTGPAGRATISELTFTPRLRHVFDETAYWAPSLLTAANGRAALHFQLSDSLTTWTLHALASTADGRITALDQTFKSFQPFFIDLDAPQVLTQGDEINLPVNLRNYTSQPLALRFTVKPADWFQLAAPPALRVSVPAGGFAPVPLALRAAASVDEGPLQLSAANSSQGDAVEKKVRVHPDGQPRALNASSLLRGASTALSLEIPADAIPGSLHAELRLYPNLGAQLVRSMKVSLERPYGCGEQTISSTYPSVLFLELLKSSKSTSDLQPTAQQYLQLGYDRLQDYFDSSGGLTYWGGNDHNPDPALTAYAIEFLLDARPFVNVDQERILAAIRWLLSVEQADGSWSPRYGGPSAELTLYIARSLTRGGEALSADAPKDLLASIQSASARALQWAGRSAEAVHDPYANALRLDLAAATGDAAAMRQSHDALIAEVDRDRKGAHWSRSGSSPFYGWGRAGDLETTALAFSALQAQPSVAADRPLQDDVLFFLLGSRDTYGVWYSGQATTRILQALLPVAVQQLQVPTGAAAFTLSINGAPLDPSLQSALRADSHLLDAPRTVDLTPFLKPGPNELVFSGAPQSALASAELSASFYTPWPAEVTDKTARTTPGKDFGLDFGYRCQAAGARPGQPIDCTVDARRFGSQSWGMLLAEVGLSPGADVDRASLAKLLDAGTISRYELQPDRIVFYLWPTRAEGVHFTFRFTPRYAIHAKAAPSTLSDYYNPDMQVVLAPQSFQVQ